MNTQIIFSNLSNPTLLFFLLGVVATLIKSDLNIPESSSKFISLYLLFAIGFKGGQELQHSGLNAEIGITLLLSMFLALLVPLCTFFILKRRMSPQDAGAIAATYGSVSAVTFVSASAFLEAMKIPSGGHMVACMALMEAPAIIVGVWLMRRYSEIGNTKQGVKSIMHESLTNGSVLMITGSLLIGLLSDAKQAEGIKPFTSDIFKGFLAIFLLEMGITSSKRFKAFKNYGWFVTLFALLVPVINGTLASALGSWAELEAGNRFLLSILAASASYIAVPAAMKIANPQSDPGLYIPMALGITFPLNITLGIPYYWWLCGQF
jgi:hypothetical protein